MHRALEQPDRQMCIRDRLLPELDVPVLITNKPLTPDVPAFIDRINTSLLDEAPRHPPRNSTRTPVDDAEHVPAANIHSLPEPLFPDHPVT